MHTKEKFCKITFHYSAIGSLTRRSEAQLRLHHLRPMSDAHVSVAIIDDDQDDLDIMEQVINGLDVKIECRLYLYPQEAVEKLTSTGGYQLPQYIFIDINMPGLSGDKCLQIFRANSAFDNVQIIMYSTSMPGKTAQQLRSAGANFVFEKPVRIKDYADILGTIITNN